jgi:dephospho-CoA kinase
MIPEAAHLLIVGLTGGIASGKSTVARYLAAAGARVIDADRIAREAVAPGRPAWQAVVAQFGKSILRADQSLDRTKLGAMVFQDVQARERLNRLVHPHVFAGMQEAIKILAARQSEGCVVLDVPLLIETGMHAQLNVVLLVYLPEAVQLQRLMRRDGLDEVQALARIRAQMPLEAKRRHATHIIDNSGSRERTRAQTLAIYRRITAPPAPYPADGAPPEAS